MDFFFKSVFSDPQPSNSADSSKDPPVVSASGSGSGSGSSSSTSATTTVGGGGGGGGGGWGFVRTLASKSESVIETYRRDLEEFGTGLEKETANLRDVAARAVRDIPVSFEETVSHAFLRIVKGLDDNTTNQQQQQQQHRPPSSRRFEIQVRAMQSDENTFREEPLDTHDFHSWSSSFDLSQKKQEIQDLRNGNPSLESIYLRLVPHSLHSDTFWGRYFYKLHKLTQVQQARANLVRRRIAKLDQDNDDDDDEDLSWEVKDDDDDHRHHNDEKKTKNEEGAHEPPPVAETKQLKVTTTAATETEEEEKEIVDHVPVTKREVIKDVPIDDQKLMETSRVVAESSIPQAPTQTASELEKKAEGSKSKYDDDDVKLVKAEKISEEGKVVAETSSYGADKLVAAAATAATKQSQQQQQQQLPKEEDLGWDEIEDLGEIDEMKATASGTNADRKSDLRKRLLAPEDDEDLSWDIEDD